jgi:hypothetical protein
MPKAYWETIAPLIERARGFLEDGQNLEPIAFVGSFEKQAMTFVVLNTGDGDVKDASAEQVRRTAHREDADFVFTIMEAWGLPPEKVSGKYQAILDRYGSIAASPYAVDVVSFALETRHGSWVAQVPVKPKGISKRKKTFDEPRFRFFSETAGRFASLLPQSG